MDRLLILIPTIFPIFSFLWFHKFSLFIFKFHTPIPINPSAKLYVIINTLHYFIPYLTSIINTQIPIIAYDLFFLLLFFSLY